MYRASLFTAQVLTRALIDTGREERSDPDPPAQPCHRGDPTDTIADTDKTSILKGSPADTISDAANTGRTVLNLVRPTTCRSAASTVPAQCDREACPETRCHVCVPRYALRSPNESLAKPVDRLRPRSCPAALTDRQTGVSSLL